MKFKDHILTFTAIFISCLALTVSIVQTRLMQKQSQASVWPRLSNSQGLGPDYFNYSVKNEGVGPAIISVINYSYKDTSFQKIEQLIHYFGKLEMEETKNPIRLNFQYGTIYTGGVIGASESIDVFTANDSISVMLGKKYLLETSIQIDYCSVYETCWRMQNDEVIAL